MSADVAFRLWIDLPRETNHIHIGMSPTTNTEGYGYGPQFFADMSNLLKAPIIEAAFVPPPKFAHDQPSSEQ